MTNQEYGISVEQMAASVAHEIRNPLALIRANLQLIESGDLENHHKKNYGVIYRELDLINQLLVQMMDITKPQCSNFSAVELTGLIEEILQDFSAVMNAREIHLRFDYTHQYMINGDAPRLKQLLINIIKNSMEAMEDIDRKKTMFIQCISDGSMVSVKIEDNGWGIPANQLEHVYTAFFTTKPGGNGLGLFVCRKIIEEHSGCFKISNRDDAGVVVQFEIPLLSVNDSCV